jgi:hypothetical protein
MPQSPRLQGNTAGRSRSGRSEPTVAGSLPPSTPHHSKNGAGLENLIITLENEWRLGLKVRDALWSPQHTDKKSITDTVYGQIKRLHYSAPPTLDEALDTFRETALGFAHNKRIGLLYGILKSKTQPPISRADTPVNEPPKTLKSVQLCKYHDASLPDVAVTGRQPALLARSPLVALRQPVSRYTSQVFSIEDQSSMDGYFEAKTQLTRYSKPVQSTWWAFRQLQRRTGLSLHNGPRPRFAH